MFPKKNTNALGTTQLTALNGEADPVAKESKAWTITFDRGSSHGVQRGRAAIMKKIASGTQRKLALVTPER